VSAELGSTMDIFTTSLLLAGGEVPDDRVIDGVDFRPVLFGTGPSPREVMFYYRGPRLMAVRKGPWKAHLITQPAYGGGGPQAHDPPVLYNLHSDPSETFDRAQEQPEIISDLLAEAERHRAGLEGPPSQLEIPLNAASP
jgi:arylsulfatase A-like enzyme